MKQFSQLRNENNVLNEAKEYFMLVQKKYPQFKIIHYSKGRKDVNEKGIPQKFTKDSAEKALDSFDYYGDYKAVPWSDK